ncbi:segregation/condensation protein A [Virgibacillus alimentarius]|uniref:Segregation and condensation protein A n=1 Tax=Virgibacillus alimentarius TaxID=698769 RepID=A0ABS4S7M6_9BACI|nr:MULTISPECIES: segregation/condensation protein A [Virgibacillus]MBP2256417.1 segregation and condensation protein A [Virgibacillus alimentarius]HLR66362.1 segregation/condensation protein A [Virgibacillus sp.]
MNQTYQVKLNAFEGPLDLLLHLINQYEIDIYDIPVATITEQYMHYIHTMKRLELNIASEYLVMAATLLEIKSQMLLPKQEIVDEPDEYMEDPREELMQRLIEYRKYKQAAEQFKDKEQTNQIFTRPPVEIDHDDVPQPIVKGDISIYDMLHALDKVFQRKKWNEPKETKIKRAEISIEERMKDVLQIVYDSETGVAFDKLFTYHTRSNIVVTFLALLELMKNNQVFCMQEQHFNDLYVFQMED